MYTQASEIFRLDRRLPEPIFGDGFDKFSFLEFDRMFAPGFWNLIAACAALAGDTEVSVIVHDPEPEAYYYSNFRRYGAFRFGRGTSAEEYSKALAAEPEGSPADAMLYRAGVVSWCGNSTTWGFWGERDLDIGIAATRQTDMSWPAAKTSQWFSCEEALSELVAPSFRSKTVPEKFAAKFRKNYCIKS